MSEGHVRSRGKGSWELKYDLGRDPLTRKRITKYATVRGSKRQAQKELRRQLTAVDTGPFTDPGKLTLGEYLTWWLDNEAQNRVAPKTLQVYRYMVDKHIRPALCACPLGQLRPLHITEYYNKKLRAGRLDRKAGLSPQSIRHHDHLLNVALKRARALNLIPRNPVEDASRPTVPDHEIQTLDDRQVAKLLTVIRGTQFYEPVTDRRYNEFPHFRLRNPGIGLITFHGLRHTHITNLLRLGVHPKIASERAGHSSVATTLDLYSHSTENLQREAAEKVDMAMRDTLEGRN